MCSLIIRRSAAYALRLGSQLIFCSRHIRTFYATLAFHHVIGRFLFILAGQEEMKVDAWPTHKVWHVSLMANKTQIVRDTFFLPFSDTKSPLAMDVK